MFCYIAFIRRDFSGALGTRLLVLQFRVEIGYVPRAMKRPTWKPNGILVTTGVLFGFAAFAKPCAADEGRVHDGLYLRLGAGLGYGVDSIGSDPLPVVGGKVDGTASGLAGASELAVGWSLARGFVLGGGLYSAFLFSPKATNVTVTVPIVGQVSGGEIDFDASSFHVFGPFADYYFNAEEGLHLQAGLGFAWLTAGDGHTKPGDVRLAGTGGSGFGLMLGFGDEWWISDSFSLGALARVTMGFMSGDDANGITWHHNAYAPALLFVATMN